MTGGWSHTLTNSSVTKRQSKMKLKFALATVAVVLLGIILNIYYRQPVPYGLPSSEEQALRMIGTLVTVSRKLDYATSVFGVENPRRLRKIVIALQRLLKPAPPSDMEITDTAVAGTPVRVYKPSKGAGTGDDKLPGLVYYHGGGWVTGNIDTFDKLCYALSKKANVIVVSVEYRLAPEHPFPAAYDDCYSVATTLLSEGATYGIDPFRIILGGDSAGGNLAAAVSQQLKDRPHHPAGQLLIYPALQFSDFTLPSMQKYGDRILDTKQMATYWSLYLNGTADLTEMFLSGSHAVHLKNTKYAFYIGLENKEAIQEGKENSPFPYYPEKVLNALTDPRVAPLMADDVAGLPRTFLMTAQFDVLSSEGLLYKRRLEEAGVDLTHKIFQSFHAFLTIKPDFTDETSRALGEAVKFLKQFEKHEKQ